MKARSQFSTNQILTVGLGVIALLVAALMLLFAQSTYDVWGALIIGPILILVTIPLFSREARQRDDPKLFWLLFGALLMKILAIIGRYYQAFYLYKEADSRAYHLVGIEVSKRFLSGNFNPGLPSLHDSDFISFLTGVVYTITRPTILGGFLVFGWLAFLGTYLFYRAFVIAVPEGRDRSYAYLIFFLPSILFWPASVGKEAWLTFTIGLTAWAVAKMLVEKFSRYLPVAALGLAGSAIVRAHYAGILGLALLVGIALRKPKRELGTLAPLAKLVVIAVGLVGAIFLVGQAKARLERYGFATSGGIDSVLQQTVQSTANGGSAFTPVLPTSPRGVVISFATVLFRPLIIEAHNVEALASAVEASFLLLLSLWRWRSPLQALRTIRRQPYVGFATAAALGFIIAMTGFANFGILARQRVLMYPFFFVLLSFPVKRAAKGTHAEHDLPPDQMPVPLSDRAVVLTKGATADA